MGLLDRPGQPQRYGLLDPNVMGLIQSGGPRVAPAPVAPAQPRRERASFWRVLDGAFGGQTVSQSLDAERARLQAEANAPQERMMAQRRLDIAQRFGGDPAWLAMQTNPGAVGENLARRLAPQVLAEGSALVTPGQINGAPIMNERRAVVGDRVVGMGGPQQAPRELLTVEPSFADRTARVTANRPIELAPGVRALRPDGSVFGEGNRRILSAADGTDLVDDNGNPIYSNERDAPVVDPVAAAAAAAAAAAGEEARAAMAANLATGLAGARQFVGSAGVWSQYNPLNRQARANLEGHLDTIKGNITFERLTEMKRNSPNGASGLGALSDNEARMLASTVAALNPDMSPEQLQRSFAVIDQLVAKLQQPSPAPAPGGVVTARTPVEAQALPPGTRYRTPDGQEYVR